MYGDGLNNIKNIMAELPAHLEVRGHLPQRIAAAAAVEDF
jgi:hypothetical protein